MDIPSRVSVFNRTLEVKGKAGLLVAVTEGHYEIQIEIKDKNIHTVLFPIAETVVIFNEPLPQSAADFEIER